MNKQAFTKFLDFLKSNNFLSDEQYNMLLTKDFPSFTEAEKEIRRLIVIDEEDWTKAKGIFYDIEYTSLVDKTITSDILNVLPQDLSESYSLVVFNKKRNNIEAGLVDPTNFKAIEALNFLARKNNFKVKYYIISQDSFDTAIKQYETLGEEVGEALDVAEDIFAPKDIDLPEEESKDVVKSAPVSKIVSVILRHAIEGRASDIHIEPVGTQSKVRYRIDGILNTTIVLPIYVHSALVSRIKVMANMKIDETRIPQDGRIHMRIHNKDVDFRISTIPLLGYEKVVMRILETPEKAPTFADNGFRGLQLKLIEKNIKEPHGLFLVTGPTGSGKSTTLFSALSYLNKEDVNIVTLEDPIEYYVPGVNQSQVKPDIKFTFATGLRALLRQDPDIIMVGEIRDNETAELAIHAGLTGHFVLSTLHTNSALGAIPRLFDMHVEPFLLANTLNIVIAQRLVGKICEKCKEKDNLPEDILAKMKKILDSIPKQAIYKDVDISNLTFYKGKGCSNCAQSGYKGRLAVSEVVGITQELKDLVAKGFNREEVKKELDKQHFTSIEQDAALKSLLGLTSAEEVLRLSNV